MYQPVPVVARSAAMPLKSRVACRVALLESTKRYEQHDFAQYEDDAVLVVFRGVLPPVLGWRSLTPSLDLVELELALQQPSSSDIRDVWRRLGDVIDGAVRFTFCSQHRLTSCTPYAGRAYDWEFSVRSEGGRWTFMSCRSVVFEESPLDEPMLGVHRRVFDILGISGGVRLVTKGDWQNFESSIPGVVAVRNEHPNSVPPSVTIDCGAKQEAFYTFERVVHGLGASALSLCLNLELRRDDYNHRRRALDRVSNSWSASCVGRVDPAFTVDSPPPDWPAGEPVWRPIATWLARRGTPTRDEVYVTCAEVKDSSGVYLEFSGNCGSFEELQGYVRKACDVELTPWMGSA